ncbi:unnamed protein product [Choristocarpus tenellus]
MLVVQLMSKIVNLRRKPPLTLMLMAAMTIIHLKPELFRELLEGSGEFLGGNGLRDVLRGAMGRGTGIVQSICLKPNVIVDTFFRQGRVDLRRLLLSAFLHGDDLHLYYNMASLLLKGVTLELSLGSMAFARTIIFTLLVSHGLVVAIAWTLFNFLDVPGPYQSCSIGFSAVLFALKYIISCRSPPGTSVRVMGLTVSARHAAWLELALISALVPNASFLGHLCGILAGILHEHALPLFLGDPTPVPPRFRGRTSGRGGWWPWSSRPSYTYRSGTSGASPPNEGTSQGNGTGLGQGGVDNRGTGMGRHTTRVWVEGGASAGNSDDPDLQEAIRRSLQPGQTRGSGESNGVDRRYSPPSPSTPLPSEAVRATPSAPPVWEVAGDSGTGTGEAASGEGESETLQMPVGSNAASELRRRRLLRFDAKR